MSDLYSSNVGQIHGNMVNKQIASFNRNVTNSNNDLAIKISGLKEQQKENEYLGSAKNLVSSAYSGAAYSTKLAEHTAYAKAGGTGFGIKAAVRNLRGNPTGSLEKISNRVIERVNPEGIQAALDQPVAPLDAHVEEHGVGGEERMENPMAEGREVTQAEHGEEMASTLGREGTTALEEGGEALASTGKWVGKLGKGLGIVGGLAAGGSAIYDDFKPGHFDKLNTAEKIGNVMQIGGAVLDVAGTLAPPLALLGGAVDILAGIIGGAGNIAEGEKSADDLDKEEESKKQVQAVSSKVGAQQITTGRTI